MYDMKQSHLLKCVTRNGHLTKQCLSLVVTAVRIDRNNEYAKRTNREKMILPPLWSSVCMVTTGRLSQFWITTNHMELLGL